MLRERQLLSCALSQACCGTQSSLRRKTRGYGLAVGLNSINTRHAILYHHLCLDSRKPALVGEQAPSSSHTEQSLTLSRALG